MMTVYGNVNVLVDRKVRTSLAILNRHLDLRYRRHAGSEEQEPDPAFSINSHSDTKHEGLSIQMFRLPSINQ